MENTEVTLENEIQICFQIMQSMDTLYEDYARKNGLTYMSLYILETIYEQKTCTQKQISEITLYPKQTVHMVIRSFLENGWVTLETATDDRRNKQIKLTQLGETFSKQVITPYWNAGICAFSKMNAEERSTMLRTLQTFTHAFAKEVKKIN